MKNNIKTISLTIFIYLVVFSVCTLLFILLFHTPILSGLHVLMYRGSVFIVFCGILSFFLMILAKKRITSIKIETKDALLMFFMFCSIHVGLFSLIPVTVERSISVFMLSYMEENSEKAFTQLDIEDKFLTLYIDRFGAFQKRFEEQVVSGNIKYDEALEGYKITPAGKRVVSLFRIVGKAFKSDLRLVYPKQEEIKAGEDSK